MRLFAGILVASAAYSLADSLAEASGDTLRVLSWGGAYEHSQRKAYFEPYTALTGTKFVVEQYDGGIEVLRQAFAAGDVPWDVIDMVMADNEQACAEGLLRPLDHSALPPAADGTPAKQDFHAGTLTRCGVPNIVSATVLAFDRRAFGAAPPRNVSALFDTERFPGRRALQRRPIAVLEWALRSFGVPRQELYGLLSTERGLRLAFRRLDSIVKHVDWWEDGATPARWLADGRVVMASGYNGRIFDVIARESVPLQILWDSQLYEYSTFGIPRGASNASLAEQFIRYATSTVPLAAQASYIAYGPARHSADALIGHYRVTDADIRPYLPTFPANFSVGIEKDHEWYARTQERLEARFEAWFSHRAMSADSTATNRDAGD